MPSLCCVTMAYNEALILPIWAKYYSSAVGEENCYVIDHGSTDGSTSSLGHINKVRIPRSAHDDHIRARFVEDFCSAMLRYYDFVLFTDVDEIVVTDPERFPTLLSYLDEAGEVTSCMGFELRHWVGHEASMDITLPILSQRIYATPSRALCKPSLIRRRVTWTPGFHSYDGPLSFGGLFLFHLAYMDLNTAMERQRKRNTQFYDSEDRVAPHHQVDPATLQSWVEGWSRYPEVEDTTFRTDGSHLSTFLAEMIASSERQEGGSYGFKLSEEVREKWRIPERFRGIF